MRALVEVLLKAAGTYNVYFAWFMQSNEEAKKEGLEQADIAKKRAQQQEQTLKEIEKLLPKNVTDIIDTVKADSNVPEEVKKSFQEFLDSYNAIKDFFNEIKGKENPSEDDYKEIKKKQKELFQKQDEILKKLMEGLDKVLE
jgi:ribosomal protein L16 Arg81 hydroxylase